MTDTAIANQLQALTATVAVLTATIQTLTAQTGRRLSRAELCERLGIHRNTLGTRLKTDARFPRPGPDGKWALADVVAWELKDETRKP